MAKRLQLHRFYCLDQDHKCDVRQCVIGVGRVGVGALHNVFDADRLVDHHVDRQCEDAVQLDAVAEATEATALTAHAKMYGNDTFAKFWLQASEPI